MNAIEDAIYDKAYANASLAAAVGTRIYRSPAPQGAIYPLVTYHWEGGGDLNETPEEAVNTVYLIQAVSDKSADEAGDLAGYIRDAFHRATLTVSGWTNIWCACENFLQAAEMDSVSGKTKWYRGHMVRIRLSK